PSERSAGWYLPLAESGAECPASTTHKRPFVRSPAKSPTRGRRQSTRLAMLLPGFLCKEPTDKAVGIHHRPQRPLTLCLCVAVSHCAPPQPLHRRSGRLLLLNSPPPLCGIR